MRNSILVTVSIKILLMASVSADVPTAINYQGRLTDGSGVPVTDGSYSVTFTIYDAPSGGNSKWTETQNVNTIDGLFAVLLGSVNPILDTVFNGTTRYLGIAVAGDPELTPRTAMVSVPYAQRVSTVDGASGGTITSEVSIGPGHTNSGADAFVAGSGNTVSGNQSAVTGGGGNTAAGQFSIVGSGQMNTAGSPYSVVGGGLGNSVQGNVSSILGGAFDTISATADYSYLFGMGSKLTADSTFMVDMPHVRFGDEATGFEFPSADGGSGQVMTTDGAGQLSWSDVSAPANSGWSDDGSVVRLETTADSVGIGTLTPTEKLEVAGNVLITGKATIGIGHTNTGIDAFVAGSNNTASGDYASVGGGINNAASGSYASVGGGINNAASDSYASVGGGINNTASGSYASVGGGAGDTASGHLSSVVGGSGNAASGYSASVGGGLLNTASGYSASVGGGRADTASGDYSSVAGGYFNTASGHYSSVGGGRLNSAGANSATIAGGGENSVGGLYSAILGGYADTITATGNYSYLFGIASKLTQDSTFMVDMPHIRFGDEATGFEFPSADGGSGQVMTTDGAGLLSWSDVSGPANSGWSDNGTVVRLETSADSVGIGTLTPSEKLEVAGNVLVTGKATIGPGNTNSGLYSFVAGGSNTASNNNTTVSGGFSNEATGVQSAVGGGSFNTASGQGASVGGGRQNTASGFFTSVGGGQYDTASGNYATVSGGRFNIASDTAAMVGGGKYNYARGIYSVVVGGGGNTIADSNSASGTNSAIAGGRRNTASNGFTSVGGGSSNTASGGHATVSGGFSNRATQTYSVVPGGLYNTASGFASFAAGFNAKANHHGSVVIAAGASSSIWDSVNSGGYEQMVLRADGGLYITNTNEVAPYDNTKLITTRGGAYLSGNGTAWTNASDKNIKENFTPVNGADVLEKISELPISEWNYKEDEESVKHIGPMAQDFHEIFGLGNDDKSISTIDPSGIALAAIKALHEKSKRVDALESELAELRTLVEALIENQE